MKTEYGILSNNGKHQQKTYDTKTQKKQGESSSKWKIQDKVNKRKGNIDIYPK